MENHLIIRVRTYFILVLSIYLLPIIGAAIDYFFFPDEFELFSEILYFQPAVWELVIYIIHCVLYIALLIGLLARKEWGRKLYIYTLFPSYLLYFLPSMLWFYASGIATFFNDLGILCMGILFIILCSPQMYTPLFNKNTS